MYVKLVTQERMVKELLNLITKLKEGPVPPTSGYPLSGETNPMTG